LIISSLAAAVGAAEPKGYVVGLVTVNNKDWIKDYRANNGELLEKHGGRILVRGKPAQVLEGTAPDAHAILVVEFPSMENARAWYNDPDYQPLIKLRQTGADVDFLLIEELQK
jgi:uncharacterized protein (DUF1330 family)